MGIKARSLFVSLIGAMVVGPGAGVAAQAPGAASRVAASPDALETSGGRAARGTRAATLPGDLLDPTMAGKPLGGEPPGSEPASGSEGARKAGLRGVLRMLAGQGPVRGGTQAEGARGEDVPTAFTPDSITAESKEDDETARRVNELVRLATTNTEKGRVEESIRNVNELIALKPYEASYHFALGLCYRAQGRHKDALKKYQDVLDLGGPKGLIAVLKAEAHAYGKERERVILNLREAATGGRNILTDMALLPVLGGYRQDTEFVKLALQLEKFGVSNNKGFDPFTNPFPKFDAQNQGLGSASGGISALSPEEQEKLLLEARKTYESVKIHIKLEDEAKAMKAYTTLRELVKKKDFITIPKIANDFRTLIAQLESLEVEIEGIRLKYYYNQAQAKLKQAKDLFADGEYKRVEAIHAEVVRLTQEMQNVNQNYRPVAEQILAASSRWQARAQIRNEFETRKPTIQGIVMASDGKMALLNNKLVRQGDALDDFRVVRVESNKVTFRYKGEDISLLFRRY